jgi:hypothetical protein
VDNSRFGCLTRSGIMVAILAFICLAALTIFKSNLLFMPGALNAQTGKPLGGVSSHAEIGGRCATCHAPFWNRPGMASLCINCHTDITAQQADPQTLHGALIQGGMNGSCWSCHPDHRGTTASLTFIDPAHFSHDKLGSPTPFPLTGAHISVACAKCHVNNVFTGTPTDCASCHPEPASHIGQFSGACTQCHSTNNWNADFNHPQACGRGSCLNHHRATCADCHPVNDSTATCTKCHRNNNPGGGD